MVKELLVMNRIDDGKDLIDLLDRDDFPVAVAFWVKTGIPVYANGGRAFADESRRLASEETRWLLYIVSSSVNPESRGRSYGRVYAALSRLVDPCLDFSEIQVLHPSEPAAREAFAIQARHAGEILVVNDDTTLGGDLFVEQMYVYPVRHSVRFEGAPELAHLSSLLEKESLIGVSAIACSYFEEQLQVLVGEPKKSFSDLIDAALEMRLLTENEHADLHSVRNLRNNFVHDPRVASAENAEIDNQINSLKTWLIACERNSAYKDLFPTIKDRLLYVVGVFAFRLRRRRASPIQLVGEPDFLDLNAWPPVTSL